MSCLFVAVELAGDRVALFSGLALVFCRHFKYVNQGCVSMQCCLVRLLQLPKSESFDSITTADSLKALGDLAQKVLNEVLVMCE